MSRFAGQRRAAAAASAGVVGVPRWPFLRSKVLSSELGRFLAPSGATEGSSGSVLWVTGAQGSGAGTAVQAAIAGATKASGNVPLCASVDCSSASSSSSSSSPEGLTTQKLFRRFEDSVRQQVAQQLADTKNSSALIRAAVDAVLERYPEAVSALAGAVEVAGSRKGMRGALPPGTELPGWREFLAKHGQEPQELVAAVSAAIVAALPRQSPLRPHTQLNAALVLLREAGARSEPGGSGDRQLPGSTEYLLTAARGLAAATQTSLAVAILRAEVLEQKPETAALMRSLCAAAAEAEKASDSSQGSLRLLVQSRDVVAAARAREEGATVLTADEWSEEMAKAIFLPRFMPSDDVVGWRGVWTAVGGHPAHLRRIGEVLFEEKLKQERARMEEEKAKKQQEENRKYRPKRSQDAEEFGKIAEQQHEEDSFRWDARDANNTHVEKLLRRLPEALAEEVSELESKVSAFARHPCLRPLQEAHAGSPGPLASALAGGVRELCWAPGGVPTPEGGVGAIADPIQLALLDVGLLVPKWSDSSGPRVVIANQMARTVLLAWAEALCADLPLTARLQCRLQLWRRGPSPPKAAAMPE